jgi:Zn-dependent protease with chaperone function
MIPVLAAIVAAGIVLPHALRLQRVPPVTAIVLWLSSLALRALAAVLAVIYLLFFLPRTQLFAALTHWCVHAAVPLGATELHIEGHALGDLALFLPGVALAVSLLYICVRMAHATRRARDVIAHHAVGPGPRNSLIVSGPEVLFAVAGLARPRIVVSAGALTCLDDDELGAALDHEQAHIVRRHRFVMLLAVAFGALGRAIPGTARAVHELGFHLERDADRWALLRTNDRLALASVICKAATRETAGHPALARLDGTGVRERLGQLLDDQPARHARSTAAALNGLATAMVMCTLLLAAIVPTAAVAGAAGDAHQAHHGQHCAH